MKNNFLIISQPRSGSTALIKLMLNRFDYDHPFIVNHKNEFLDVCSTFFPTNSSNGELVWDDQVDKFYEDWDWKSLNNYYKKNNFAENHIYYKPKLVNGKIEININNWQDHKLFTASSKKQEQKRRINMLKKADPWIIKCLDYQISDYSWINRSNTTVIALYRTDAVDSVASWLRQRQTNTWHTTENITSQTEIHPVGTLDNIKDNILSKQKFKNLLDGLDPDIIVTYEWMIESGSLDNSELKKINQNHNMDYFSDYNSIRSYADKNNVYIKMKNPEQLWNYI